MTKKILFIVCLVLLMFKTKAQTNTFPSSGSVGIGTTSPINGWKLQIEHAADNNNYFLGFTGNGNGRLYLGTDANANAYIRSLNNVDLRLGVNASDHLTIKYGGNIGINTTSPTQKLEVNGAGVFTGNALTGTVTGTYILNGGIYSLAGGNSNPLNIGGQYIGFYAGTTYIERLRISESGKVGIGTSTPNALLDLSLPSGQSGRILTMSRSQGSYAYHIGVTSDSRYVLYDNDGSTERFTVMPTSGYVGLGTSNPSSSLHVALPSGQNGKLITMSRSASAYSYHFGVTSTNRFVIYDSDGTTERFSISPTTGNIGIGITDPGSYKLAVNGDVKVKKIVVSVNGWSDYVFDSHYQLMPLSSVENFIRKNKHLPDVPSAKEVEEKGISVGDNQALLLRKIEELTLYLIDIKKENESLKARMVALEQKK